MIISSVRKRFLYCFLLCLIAIFVSIFLQVIWNEAPCPLCIIQRLDVILMGIVFFMAFLHNPQALGVKVYSFILLLLGIGGLSVSLRQVWLQHLPKDLVPACGAGLSTLIKMFPPQKVITLLLQGSGECAQVHGRFLNLSLAGWTGIFFAFLMFMCLWQLLAADR